MKPNKLPLIMYADFNAKKGISVPAHRIVRSEGFKQTMIHMKEIFKKIREDKENEFNR